TLPSLRNRPAPPAPLALRVNGETNPLPALRRNERPQARLERTVCILRGKAFETACRYLVVVAEKRLFHRAEDTRHRPLVEPFPRRGGPGHRKVRRQRPPAPA